MVERGSTHIRTQRAILNEEYERLGLRPDVPTDEFVEREEKEYELADGIAVPSSFARQTFVRQGVAAEKLFTIPYGVDTDRFRPVPKEDTVFRVVFAGSLSVRKGALYLLKTFADLALPNSELLLVGAISEEAKAWLGRYGSRVRHPGSIAEGHLNRWYSQGSVFVLPSVEEGMAVVQLQAMACGLPLICTPHTGGTDLIRHGEEGFVVPVRDTKALKDRLEWCYEHQSVCRDMGAAARRRVLTHFTWQQYGVRVLSAYSSLLSKALQ